MLVNLASLFKRRVYGLYRLLRNGFHSVRIAYDDAAHSPLPTVLTSALQQSADAAINEGGLLVNIPTTAEEALADGQVELAALPRENIDDAHGERARSLIDFFVVLSQRRDACIAALRTHVTTTVVHASWQDNS